MINFGMGLFWQNLILLQHEISLVRNAAQNDPKAGVPADEAKRIQSDLDGLFRQCAELGLESCDRTIVKIERADLVWTTYGELAAHLERLREDIEHDVKREYFFHYSKENAALLRNIPQKWGSVFAAFKATKPEVEAGIDCFALGHNTACVFHMCRIAEIGLQAIGRERGIITVRRAVPIEWGTWGQIFQAIEPEIDKINQQPNGPAKEAALAFYETVLSDLRAIKGLYRDQTMHLRDVYDPGEAQSAMFRAHSVMHKLSTKLNDQMTDEIPWSAWP